jgi:hypothetical protein
MGTPSGQQPASEVLAALQRHGFSEPVAQLVWAVGADLRERTQRDGVEFAAMLEADTGEPLGEVLGGGEQVVDARPHFRAMLAGRRYVQIHSHPSSSAFSRQDALILTSFPELRASVVIGLDGTWYVLSRTDANASILPELVSVRFQGRFAALWPTYRALVQTQLVPASEAWRAHSHDIWTHIGPELGLRYDRIEAGGEFNVGGS